MTQFANRIVYPLVLYAFLLIAALLVGLHAPARGDTLPSDTPPAVTATVWSPSLKFDNGAQLVRPPQMGTFPNKESCEKWVLSDEGLTELQAVADAYASRSGASPTALECIERKVDTSALGHPA